MALLAGSDRGSRPTPAGNSASLATSKRPGPSAGPSRSQELSSASNRRGGTDGLRNLVLWAVALALCRGLRRDCSKRQPTNHWRPFAAAAPHDWPQRRAATLFETDGLEPKLCATERMARRPTNVGRRAMNMPYPPTSIVGGNVRPTQVGCTAAVGTDRHAPSPSHCTGKTCGTMQAPSTMLPWQRQGYHRPHRPTGLRHMSPAGCAGVSRRCCTTDTNGPSSREMATRATGPPPEWRPRDPQTT